MHSVVHCIHDHISPSHSTQSATWLAEPKLLFRGWHSIVLPDYRAETSPVSSVIYVGEEILRKSHAVHQRRAACTLHRMVCADNVLVASS